jgi:hypothetical protein
MRSVCLLQVGRIDHAEANPENSLLPGEATLTEMDSYWTARGMTMEEGVALLGIHALMEVCCVWIVGVVG